MTLEQIEKHPWLRIEEQEVIKTEPVRNMPSQKNIPIQQPNSVVEALKAKIRDLEKEIETLKLNQPS